MRKVVAERVARSDLCRCVGGIVFVDEAFKADVWEMGILSVAAMMGCVFQVRLKERGMCLLSECTFKYQLLNQASRLLHALSLSLQQSCVGVRA